MKTLKTLKKFLRELNERKKQAASEYLQYDFNVCDLLEAAFEGKYMERFNYALITTKGKTTVAFETKNVTLTDKGNELIKTQYIQIITCAAVCVSAIVMVVQYGIPALLKLLGTP